jgi:hypothetical protein
MKPIIDGGQHSARSSSDATPYETGASSFCHPVNNGFCTLTLRLINSADTSDFVVVACGTAPVVCAKITDCESRLVGCAVQYRHHVHCSSSTLQ